MFSNVAMKKLNVMIIIQTVYFSVTGPALIHNKSKKGAALMVSHIKSTFVMHISYFTLS